MQSFKASKLQEFLIKTIAYADIFDYPLRLDEIKKYLIGERAEKILIDRKSIGEKEGFYFLKGREGIVETRKEREKWSGRKLIIAQRTAEKLKIIPFVKMIGITGALSMDNCQEDDDIDLLIITDADCLWLTRLLIILLSPLLGIKRRKPKERNVKDKICFNLFLEENHLKIEPENLFLAHEICQERPIFDRNNTYTRFIKENEWVSNFLPNAKNSSKFKIQNSKFKKNRILSFFNNLAFRLQFWYMKPKMTVERVNLHQAFFHPGNMEMEVENKYRQSLSLLGLDNS